MASKEVSQHRTVTVQSPFNPTLRAHFVLNEEFTLQDAFAKIKEPFRAMRFDDSIVLRRRTECLNKARSRVKSYFTNALLPFHLQTCHSLRYSRQMKSSTSSRRLGRFLITELKGTSEAYLQPADSAPTFSPFLVLSSQQKRAGAKCCSL